MRPTTTSILEKKDIQKAPSIYKVALLCILLRTLSKYKSIVLL